MKTWFRLVSFCTVGLVLCGSALTTAAMGADSIPVLTISGEVKRPLQLTVGDLSKFQAVEIQLNEVNRDKQFRGVYRHQAVPLRTLLDMAGIVKQDQPFTKEIDLAIRVTGAAGKQVILSWGEVYYSKPAEVAIAFAADSVKPMMTETRCLGCHGPEIYKSALEQYEQPARLPKLLVGKDFYTDRCLEEVTRIEVLDLYPPLKVDRSAKLETQEILVTGAVKKERKFKDFKNFPSMEMTKKVVGVHMGYHGLHRYKGVSLAKVLEAAGVEKDLAMAVMISAPDGYRALFSMGELFQSFGGQRIMIAESDNGKSLAGQRGGNYRIIVPEELVDDRDVLAVNRIEVIDLKAVRP